MVKFCGFIVTYCEARDEIHNWAETATEIRLMLESASLSLQPRLGV